MPVNYLQKGNYLIKKCVLVDENGVSYNVIADKKSDIFKEEITMALSDLFGWGKKEEENTAPAAACGAVEEPAEAPAACGAAEEAPAACGAADAPEEAPVACGAADEAPAACGAADKAEEKPAACGSACGAGDEK